MALGEVTTRIRQLTAGWAPEAGDPLFPPPDSGILGASVGPADLTVTVAFGASLFDDRFGLASKRPKQLEKMPFFPNDRLQPGLSHGDLMLQICAADEASCVHALRYLMAGSRSSLVVKWLIHGFQQRPAGGLDAGGTAATSRNLLGFKDGTANPHATDTTVMDDIVWIGKDDGEPDWAVGGTYMVVRPIRMFVERWDRTALGEQEARHRADEADRRSPRRRPRARRPRLRLGSRRVTGSRWMLTSGSRTRGRPASARNLILRRGYSYSRGFDEAGLLDEGLLFVCFQRDLEAGFVTIQNRLAGEPLEEYIQTVGGGYFFAPPGLTTSDGILGGSLLT